jgi:hypothetical protein
MFSTHVDDILQVSTDPLLITELHTRLVVEKRYTHVSFNENVDSYLGMTMLNVSSSDNSSVRKVYVKQSSKEFKQ